MVHSTQILIWALHKNTLFLDFYLTSHLFFKLLTKIFFLVNNLFIMVLNHSQQHKNNVL